MTAYVSECLCVCGGFCGGKISQRDILILTGRMGEIVPEQEPPTQNRRVIGRGWYFQR